MSAATAERVEAPDRGLSQRASRLLTVALVLAAAAFVALTVGTSLIGKTSFYAGGILVNNKPWVADGYGSIPVTNNYVGDTIDSVIPGRHQLVERALHGDFPGWNSLTGGGSALASVPSYGLFAPTAAAWWLLPASLAPGWEKLTCLVLATAGAALFLRRLGAGRHAAWLAGMIYAGSGFMLAWTNWPQADVAAMVPWLFWAAERALQLRTWRAQIPVALAVASLLLGGFPAVTGLAMYAAAGYVIMRLIGRRLAEQPRLRAALSDIGKLVVGLLTGVLVAGLQLVPFAYSFASLDTSYRADGFGRIQPLKMALTSLFPNAWGTLGGGPFRLNPIETNAYIGVAAAVLAAVALLVGVRGRILRGARSYFAGVVGVGFLLIYVQGPLVRWVGHLPVFSGNAIGRLVSIVLFAAAVLAGIGFDAVLRSDFRNSRASLVRLGAALAVAVGGVGFLALWVHGQTAGKLDPATQHKILEIAAVGTVLTAAVIALAVLRPSWKGLLLAVVPVVVVAQGVSAASPMWAQVDRRDFFPTTAAHRYLEGVLGHDRMAVAGAPMVNGSTAYYGLRSATGHEFTSPELSLLQIGVCPICRLTATYWVLPGSSDLNLWQSPGLDRMAVRYLSADPETAIPGTAQQLTTGDRELPVPTDGQAPMVLSVPGGPLRGIQFDFRSGPPKLSHGDLVVEVHDATGKTLLSTRRLVQYPRAAVPLYVPLAGENLPTGGTFTITVKYDGATTSPVLAGSSDGVPSASVIRPAADGLRLVYAGDVEVWERTNALPRIRWADRARVIGSPEARVTALTRGTVPDDTVVLDRPGAATAGLPAVVQVQRDDGDVVRARVAAQGAGYLVLADSIQRDWTVTVDGHREPLVAADEAYGAVSVPAGVHEVSFTYTPRGAMAGRVMSVLGLALLVLLALPTTWWRRRRTGSPRRESRSRSAGGGRSADEDAEDPADLVGAVRGSSG